MSASAAVLPFKKLFLTNQPQGEKEYVHVNTIKVQIGVGVAVGSRTGRESNGTLKNDAKNGEQENGEKGTENRLAVELA